MTPGNEHITYLNFRFLVAPENQRFVGQRARLLRAVGAFVNKRWHKWNIVHLWQNVHWQMFRLAFGMVLVKMAMLWLM